MLSSVQYLRFVLSVKHEDTGVPVGPFRAAYRIRDHRGTPDQVRDRLVEIIKWFEHILDEPARFGRTKSKGKYRRSTKGISWFKDSAQEHIGKMREMVAILGDYEYVVEQICTRRPGYIVYEDDHQIVAEAFQETFS